MGKWGKWCKMGWKEGVGKGGEGAEMLGFVMRVSEGRGRGEQAFETLVRV